MVDIRRRERQAIALTIAVSTDGFERGSHERAPLPVQPRAWRDDPFARRGQAVACAGTAPRGHSFFEH